MAITVSSVGEANGVPDTVEIDVGVSVLAGNVAEATKTAAESGETVLAALTAAGVAEADVSTTEYTIQPEYDYSGNQQRLLGYRVGNTMRAKVRDVGRAGEIVDSVSAAGGDHSRVRGLRFGVEDDDALEASARVAAWNDAVAKATQLATLSGQTLGRATSITETVRSPAIPVRMMAADMAMAEGATTPIQPGTTMVTVDLRVEFAVSE